MPTMVWLMWPMTTIPFGGMNVIIVSNFHQFPPVAKTTSTLYNTIMTPINVWPQKLDKPYISSSTLWWSFDSRCEYQILDGWKIILYIYVELEVARERLGAPILGGSRMLGNSKTLSTKVTWCMMHDARGLASSRRWALSAERWTIVTVVFIECPSE